MRKPLSKNPRQLTDEQLAILKKNAYGILCETRRTLLDRFPFVGSIAMSLDLVPTRDCRIDTMATDGQAIYCDIDFLSTLSPDDRLFIIAHEIYHCVLMHLIRQENRNPELFNIATDIEVNELLREDGLSIPATGCSAAKFFLPLGLNAETYYKLLSEKQLPRSSQQGTGQNGSGSGNGGGERGEFADKHIYKDDPIEETGNEETQDKYGKVGYDSDYRPSVKSSNIEKIREAAVAAAQMIAQRGGHLPDHQARLVNGLLNPKLDWKELLAQFVTKVNGDHRTWNRCNRRFISSRTYLPSSYTDKLKIAVGIDTSGSVYNHLEKFLSEIKGIVENFDYELTIIQCDTAVRNVQRYDAESPLDLETTKFEVHGGGGTTLSPIFTYIEDEQIDCDCCVVITDGECEQFSAENAPNFPVLWCVTTSKHNKNFGFGDIAELD